MKQPDISKCWSSRSHPKEKLKVGIERYRYLILHRKIVGPAFDCVFLYAYGLYASSGIRKQGTQCIKIIHSYQIRDIATFEEALSTVQSIRGELKLAIDDEVACATKLVHTIYPELPIIDSHIRTAFGISEEDVSQNLEEVLRNVYNYYKEVQNNQTGKKILAQFKKIYCCRWMSYTKVIDYILWSSISKQRSRRKRS